MSRVNRKTILVKVAFGAGAILLGGMAGLGASVETAPSGDSAASPGEKTQRTNEMIELVGGEPMAEVVWENGEWTCGPCRIGSPLPVGYPRPTAPGAIELKVYPSVRRAEVVGAGSRGSSVGFFPLFRHITSRDIAMTAPVEMDYSLDAEDHGIASLADRDDVWRMSFLYRDSDLGPTGDAENGVRVVDSQPVTVVSHGFRGRRTSARIAEAEAVLTEWIESSEEWQSTGARRWMGYNGPSTPASNQGWEVQFVIEPITEDDGRQVASDSADSDV